jgi:hypothetical protein
VAEFDEELAIPARVVLETGSGTDWLAHAAQITNLTRHEVWIRLEESLGDVLRPERKVRLVLRRADGESQTAETMVLWHIGSEDMMVALLRPAIWNPPSRRAHSRARLAIPVHLRPEADAAPILAQTTDIGVGGLHCLSESPFEIGQVVQVSVLLTPGDSFECRAEVVRIGADREDPSGRRTVVALRFLELTGDAQAALAASLSTLAEDVDSEAVPLAWRGGDAQSVA